MSSVVLDASALLAALFREPGVDTVSQHIEHAVISAVNLSEALVKAVDRGVNLEAAAQAVRPLSLDTVAFDTEHAALAASLRATTRQRGLSFGDRACLALGLKTGLPVLTADQAWAGLDIGVEIRLVR